MKTRLAIYIALLWLAFQAARADAAIMYSGGTYTENFNSLPDGSGSGGQSLSPIVNAQTLLAGTTGFVGTKLSGTGTTFSLSPDNGGSSTNNLKSFGAALFNTERALGTLAGVSTVPAFGVEVVNNTGGPITGFTLSLFREQWRRSLDPNTISFAYGVSGGAATSANFLSHASLTPLPTFNLTSGALGGPAPLNGNLAENRVQLTGAIPAFVPAGASLFLRWQDTNEASNAGLAIDDMTLIGVPEPSTGFLLGLGIFAVAFRGIWPRRTAKS